MAHRKLRELKVNTNLGPMTVDPAKMEYGDLGFVCKVRKIPFGRVAHLVPDDGVARREFYWGEKLAERYASEGRNMTYAADEVLAQVIRNESRRRLEACE